MPRDDQSTMLLQWREQLESESRQLLEQVKLDKLLRLLSSEQKERAVLLTGTAFATSLGSSQRDSSSTPSVVAGLERTARCARFGKLEVLILYISRLSPSADASREQCDPVGDWQCAIRAPRHLSQAPGPAGTAWSAQRSSGQYGSPPLGPVEFVSPILHEADAFPVCLNYFFEVPIADDRCELILRVVHKSSTEVVSAAQKTAPSEVFWATLDLRNTIPSVKTSSSAGSTTETAFAQLPLKRADAGAAQVVGGTSRATPPTEGENGLQIAIHYVFTVKDCDRLTNCGRCGLSEVRCRCPEASTVAAGKRSGPGSMRSSNTSDIANRWRALDDPAYIPAHSSNRLSSPRWSTSATFTTRGKQNHEANVALFSAIGQHNRDAVVRALLDGADVNTVNQDDMTPLMYAAACGDSDACLAVLEHPDTVLEAADREGRTALITAAALGHADIVSLLLQKGCNPAALIPRLCRTALHFAAANGHGEAVSLLLDYHYGALNMPDAQGNTPLMFAATSSSIDASLQLIRRGADLNTRNAVLLSPLMMGAGMGQLAQCNLLLASGADPNAVDVACMTAVMWAACRLHRELCLFLLRNGARLDIQSTILADPNQRYFPLPPAQDGATEPEAKNCGACNKEFGFAQRRHECVFCSGTYCFDCVREGIVINLMAAKRPAKCCAACERRSTQVAELLRGLGRSGYPGPVIPFFPFIASETFRLLQSIEARDVQGVHKALSSGANPNSLATLAEPLYVKALRDKNGPIIDVLLRSSSTRPDIFDLSGVTPVTRAVQLALPDAIRLLAGRGARLVVDTEDGERYSMLHIVASTQMTQKAGATGGVMPPPMSEDDALRIASLLLEFSVPVDLPDTVGNTPLMISVRTGSLRLSQLLLDAGASVVVQNVRMETPLMIAAAVGNLPQASLLLDAGAAKTIQECDAANCNALYWAACSGNKPLLELLFAAAGNGAKISVPRASDASGYLPLRDTVPLDALPPLVEPGTKCSLCELPFIGARHPERCAFCGAVFCGSCVAAELPSVREFGLSRKACSACTTRSQVGMNLVVGVVREIVWTEIEAEVMVALHQDTPVRSGTSFHTSIGALQDAVKLLDGIVEPIADAAMHAFRTMEEIVRGTPIGPIFSVMLVVVTLARNAVVNKQACIQLASRMQALAGVIAYLRVDTNQELTLSVRRLESVLAQASRFLKQFQPATESSWVSRLKSKVMAIRDCSATFKSLHDSLSHAVNDLHFTRSVVMPPPPTLAAITDLLTADNKEILAGLQRIETLLVDISMKVFGTKNNVLDPAEVVVDEACILGKGATATVFKGTLRSSGDRVAVKKLHNRIGGAQSEPLEELKLLMRSQHPHVVKVIGVLASPTNHNEFTAIVLEYLQYGLEELIHGSPRLQTNYRLTPHDKWQITVHIAYAMNHLHYHTGDGSIVHQDLKPNNIMVNPDGHGGYVAKLIDFGIARVRGTRQLMTRADGGTSAYMAPEALEGGVCGKAIDVYSYGVLVGELWTGQRPWDGLREQAISLKVLSGERPFKEFPGVPPVVVALIKQCWDQCPEERPSFAYIAALKDQGNQIIEETDPLNWPKFLRGSLPAPSAVAASTTPLRRALSMKDIKRMDTEQLLGWLEQMKIDIVIVDRLRSEGYDGQLFFEDDLKKDVGELPIKDGRKTILLRLRERLLNGETVGDDD